jgi:hypothetical protein
MILLEFEKKIGATLKTLLTLQNNLLFNFLIFKVFCIRRFSKFCFRLSKILSKMATKTVLILHVILTIWLGNIDFTNFNKNYIGKFIDFYLFITSTVSCNFSKMIRDARCFFLFHFPCLPFMDIFISNGNSPSI